MATTNDLKQALQNHIRLVDKARAMHRQCLLGECTVNDLMESFDSSEKARNLVEKLRTELGDWRSARQIIIGG